MSSTDGASRLHTSFRRRSRASLARTLVSAAILAAALSVGSSAAVDAVHASPLRTSFDAGPASTDADPGAVDRVAHLSVTPLEAFPGGTVHVTGTCTLWGFAATRVLLFFQPDDETIHSSVAPVPIDADTGAIDADVTVPSEARPGLNRLGWMCTADDMAFGGHDQRIPFTILGPASTPPVTPETGSTGSSHGPESSPPETVAASGPGDSLAATGLQDPSSAVAIAGTLTALGITILVFAGRRLDVAPLLVSGAVIGSTVGLVFSAPADATQQPPQNATHPSSALREDAPLDRVAEMTVSPLEAATGDTVHVKGICTLWGFAATYAHISFEPVGENSALTGVLVPVDPHTGVIDADVVVPSDARPGRNSVGWTCAADDMVFGAHDQRIPFTILGPAATPPAAPQAGSAGSTHGTESSATETPTVSGPEDDLAATGLHDSSATLVIVAVLTALGAAIVVFARRRLDARPPA